MVVLTFMGGQNSTFKQNEKEIQLNDFQFVRKIGRGAFGKVIN